MAERNTSSMVPTAPYPAKGGYEAKLALPPARVPGDYLAQRICDLQMGEHPRPSWRLGARPDVLRGVAVPRLDRVAMIVRGSPRLISPGGAEPRRVLRRRLALALETDHPEAFDQLQAHDRREWLRLYAAALRDIVALDYGSVGEACGYEDIRTARRAVSAGRKLWRQLAAWPWRYFGPNGLPPAGWREHGGGPQVNAAFATWATGAAHVLGDNASTWR